MATRQDVVSVLIEKTEKKEIVWQLVGNDTWDSPWIRGCYFRVLEDGRMKATLRNVEAPLVIRSEHTAKLRETIADLYAENEPSDDEKLERAFSCLTSKDV